MSLDSIFSNAIMNRVGQNLGNPEFDLHTFILGINQLNQSIKFLADQTPKPWIFLKGPSALSSNVNANVEILVGPQVPQGYKATIKDFNLVFSTAAGTVAVVIMDANRNIIQTLFTATATVNGIGETVLEENQRLAVVGSTAGAGVFTVYCSGIVQKFVRLDTQ